MARRDKKNTKVEATVAPVAVEPELSVVNLDEQMAGKGTYAVGLQETMRRLIREK